MMREILFRGKQTNAGFAYGSLIKCGGYCCILPDDDGEGYDSPYLDNDTGCIDGYALPVNPETVGQFTGLTDKNGKQIFEGDIVEPALIGGTHKGFSWGKQVVVFDRGAFCLKSRRGEITPMCNYAANVQFKVWGNIHDNPELLEVN